MWSSNPENPPNDPLKQPSQSYSDCWAANYQSLQLVSLYADYRISRTGSSSGQAIATMEKLAAQNLPAGWITVGRVL